MGLWRAMMARWQPQRGGDNSKRQQRAEEAKKGLMVEVPPSKIKPVQWCPHPSTQRRPWGALELRTVS